MKKKLWKAIQNYRSNRLATSKSHSSTTANVTNTQMSNCTPRVVHFVKRSTVTHNPIGSNRPRSGTASMNRHASGEANGSWHKIDHDKGARQNQSRSSGNVSHRKNSSGNTPKNTSLDNVECWRCHKKGHYSSSCPNTQQVFAAQVIEEDGETEPQIPSEKPNDNGEGHIEQDDPVEDHNTTLLRKGFPSTSMKNMWKS